MTMRGENWRFWIPVALLLLLAAYSGQKLIRSHIAIDPNIKLPNYYFTRPQPARRGSIYSSYGSEYPFVKSVPYWEYRLDPVALTNAVVKPSRREKPRTRAAIAKTIAIALGIDYKTLLGMCEKTSNRYQYLALSSDPDVHRTLADSRYVAGLSILDRQIRQYLHGRRLCHVLGFLNGSNVGKGGIEQHFEGELAGTPGQIRGMKDAHQHELYDKRILTIDPKPGTDIYLTIDHNIQFEAEDALKWGVNEFGAGTGWCIVMDSRTGAILAMASSPDFDPTSYADMPKPVFEYQSLNRAIAFNYEPGSVMKVITAAAAFDSQPGRYQPSTLYSTARNDSRYYKLPGDGSHVWEPYMTLRDAIVHSSNIVIGKLGCDLGPKQLWTYMKRFGFGEKTGIELPGEQKGILRNYKAWDKATYSRAAIGQGVSVTAIQLISAYQAIANDGVRMRPYLVGKTVEKSKDGEVQSETVTKPVEVGRPIRPETARKMRDVMLDVASPKGTARRAAIRGYSVAGKTGTAQKSVGRTYAAGLYRASFCGIVPASEPRLVVLVTLDFDNRTLYHQGGNSAGPVFKRIATAALRYLSIDADRPDEISEFDEDEFDKITEERARKNNPDVDMD